MNQRAYVTVDCPIDLNFIPSGDVYTCREWDFPIKTESLTAGSLRDFVISRFPITVAQYLPFLEASDGFRNEIWRKDRGGGSYTQIDWEQSSLNLRANTGSPALITRYEAIAYCRWLSSRTGKRFAVPTESHWVRAARGAMMRRYPWGDDFNSSLCHCTGSEEDHWMREVRPVNEFPRGASIYGVEDLVGNSPEWVALTAPVECDDALAGTDQEQLCEASGVFHNRGTWSYEKNPLYYSCDYRGNSYAPMPHELAAFRVSGPAF
jgi:formylglycine-generating enzyme required for sulfatase activity